MKKHFKIFFIVLFLAQNFSAFSQDDIPDAPKPARLVNDLAGILDQSQVASLETKLVNFDDTTSTQIAIVTVKSLNGYSKEEFTDRIGEKWGVGRKGKDNGVLILIKPKYGNERGQARISVGYGLEGAIPDAIANRIVNYDLIPYFKQGDYYTGLDKATSTIMSLASGEFSAEYYKKKTQSGAGGVIVPIILIIIVIILFSRNSGKHYNSGSRPANLWTALWLASMMSGGRGSGSWGNFNSGGGGFGGGGFGGFGGGSFGGGGAGGSW